MTKKKGNVKHIIHFDLEDDELLSFPWYEDEDPPPIVKRKVKKKKEKDSEKKNKH
jgi:hypothetical protein